MRLDKLDSGLTQLLQLLLAFHKSLLLFKELTTQMDLLLKQRKLQLSFPPLSLLDKLILQENLCCCPGVGLAASAAASR